MPIHVYWGEDEFLLSRAVNQLRSPALEREWASFNYSQYPPEEKDSISQAIADLITPPVGSGSRLIYLPNSTLLGVCSKEILQQLEQILPIIPETNVLLITSYNKPDARNKSVKLLQQNHAEIKEFSPIAYWQTDALLQQVQDFANEIGVTLSNDACKLLVESVGNNTRLLVSELKKLQVYAGTATIDANVIGELVDNSAASSLQLATAIRTGDTQTALELLESLINCNEPTLKITATLITQFRTWLIVKLAVKKGWRDDTAIAQIAEVKNPKRLYFIRQEIAGVDAKKLQNTLHALLQLELMLKGGMDGMFAISTQIIKICSF